MKKKVFAILRNALRDNLTADELAELGGKLDRGELTNILSLAVDSALGSRIARELMESNAWKGEDEG